MTLMTDKTNPTKIGYVVYFVVRGDDSQQKVFVQEFDHIEEAEELKAAGNRGLKRLSLSVGMAYHHRHEDKAQERIEIRPRSGDEPFDYTDMIAFEDFDGALHAIHRGENHV